MILIAYAAPFAVFRDFTAGYLRSTFGFAPPSALYGLLLHVAGIEMRGELGPGTTDTRENLPRFRIASAARGPDRRHHSFASNTSDGKLPGTGMLFQQLHTIPVGTSSKERIPTTKGNKHHIAPARREILHSYRGYCLVDGDATLEERLAAQLKQPTELLADNQPRYGVPFLGDNNFFLEELALSQFTDEWVDWLVVAREDEDAEDEDDQDAEVPTEDRFPFRLTVWADRLGMKGTRDAVFRIRAGALNAPPRDAWVEVGPPTLS